MAEEMKCSCRKHVAEIDRLLLHELEKANALEEEIYNLINGLPPNHVSQEPRSGPTVE